MGKHGVTHRRRTHVVYRCWDAEGELLYIGATFNLRDRVYAHRCSTAWWGGVASIGTTRSTNIRAALRYERLAIKSEHPRHNIAHRA